MSIKSEHIKRRNAELVRLIKESGDQKATLELIELNTPLIIKTALSFNAPKELDDLISEGIAAMLASLKDYDLSRDTNFMSFASWKILYAMQSYMDSLRAVKVTRYQSVKMIKEGRYDELHKLTYACDFDKIGEVDRYNFLDNPEILIMEDELKREVRKALNRLENKKMRAAIILYFGIGCEKMKMINIAKLLGVSQSAISYYIKNGIKILRNDQALFAHFKEI